MHVHGGYSLYHSGGTIVAALAYQHGKVAQPKRLNFSTSTTGTGSTSPPAQPNLQAP
jgi:hypothetical protein